MLGKTTPILRILDEARGLEYYAGFLGFSVDWEHRFAPGLPLYMQVSKDGCVLHLSGHTGDCKPGAGIRIEADDVEAYRAELVAKHAQYPLPPIEETPWDTRELSIEDPFGNRLTFFTSKPPQQAG